MPTLRGFDEEFGQAAGVTQLDRTRSILLAVALGAAILGGLTLAWLAVDGSVRPKVASSAPTSPRNTAPVESRELVDRLLSQVEALKSEVRELTEAQQQPAHAIAAIEAEQESRNRAPPVHWYSDPAALSSGLESRPEPWGVVPLPRRPRRAHVLHCVRCSRAIPARRIRVLHLAPVRRSAGAVKAESLVNLYKRDSFGRPEEAGLRSLAIAPPSSVALWGGGGGNSWRTHLMKQRLPSSPALPQRKSGLPDLRKVKTRPGQARGT